MGHARHTENVTHMLNPNPYMLLSNTLGFSAADLTANRLGQLTPRQRQHLAGQRSRALGWPLVLLIILLLGALALHIEWFLTAFLAACLMSIILATWQRFTDDFEGHIQAIVGTWTIQPQPLGRTLLIINDQTFSLPKRLDLAFTDHTHYRLYYTAGTHTILSAEIL